MEKTKILLTKQIKVVFSYHAVFCEGKSLVRIFFLTQIIDFMFMYGNTSHIFHIEKESHWLHFKGIIDSI